MTQKDRLDDSRSNLYADQLNRGFRGLRFLPELERDYRRYMLEDSFALKRIALSVGMLVWLAFIGIDLLILAGPPLWGVLAVRLGVLVLLLVCGCLIMLRRHIQLKVPLSIACVLAQSTPLAVAYPSWALAALGMGLAYNTTSTTAMAHTREGAEGETSTALGIADALGFSLSAGLGGAILAAGERAGWPIADSLAIAWAATAVVGFALLVTSPRMRAAPRAVAPSGGRTAVGLRELAGCYRPSSGS